MKKEEEIKSQEKLKQQAAKLLKQIDPKLQPYGKNFFEPLARLIVNIGIETVFIRFNTETNEYETLLRKRNEDETYPGQWHVPGSLLRFGEEFDDVFHRILTEECGAIEVSSSEFVGLHNNITEARGHIVQIVYRFSVEYNGKSEAGSCLWFSLSNLPGSIVDHHAEVVIPMVERSLCNE